MRALSWKRIGGVVMLSGSLCSWGCLGGAAAGPGEPPAALDGDVGTGTGNPSDGQDPGSPTGEGNHWGSCSGGTPESVGRDAQTELGFSAADVLAYAQGTHDESLRWNSIDSASYGPESGESTITITLTPLPDGTRFINPPMEGDRSGEEGRTATTDIVEPVCRGIVEIDVEARVRTAGGALDERFEGTLRATSELQATLLARLKPEDLGGSFEITEVAREGFTLAQLDLAANFSQFGANGTIDAILERRTDDAVGVAAGGGPPLADWGTARCMRGIAIGGDDEVEGLSVQAALDVIDAQPAVTVSWSDGQTSQASLDFTPDAQGACLLLEDESSGELGPQLLIAGRLDVHSDDGRLDAQWPGTLHVASHADGTTEVAFELATDGSLPSVTADNLSTVYGLPMIDGSGYDALSMSFGLSLSSVGGTSSVTGEVQVTGFTEAPCGGGEDPDQEGSDGAGEPMPDPEEAAPGGEDGEPGEAGGMGSTPSSGGGMSSPGCRGADATVLASGSLG